MSSSIHPDTKLGAAYLSVANLERSLAFYQDHIGLSLQRQDGDSAVLGVGDRDFLRLKQQTGAYRSGNTTVLYHFALLVPSRIELARTLQNLANTETPLSGLSDHSVSEAIYLSDPDGHGIEIYRDRPRSEWQYENGKLFMTTAPFDANGVLSQLNGSTPLWTGMHAGTVMGHMHLHVADLAAAVRFYEDILGFDLVMRYGPSAAFLSAGGYHHHIGLNTWAGVGAPPPPAHAPSLKWFEIVLPDAAALGEVELRIQAAQLPYNLNETGLLISDPSGNQVYLSSKNQQKGIAI